MFREFEEKGFYTNWAGEKINESDFHGVYIAGGSEPLSWDFENLSANPDYRLHDENSDGIYEATFIFNPSPANSEVENEWVLSNDISAYPKYSSDQLLVDALYKMSLDETMMLKEDDGTFRTGAKWEGVWTRDISYSVLLAYAFLDLEFSKTSLMKKVKNDRIIQDTGSGGAWPVSTDRIVWSIAAWEIYLVSGDESWLEYVYPIIRNSFEDDIANHILDERFGLFKGESSFLDWREQTYPRWMDNVDISQSLNLGTNADFYQSLNILSEMAEALGELNDAEKYHEKAEALKQNINQHFWNEELGYYEQYLYGRHYLASSPKFEALGNALCILFDIADENKKMEIVSKAPVIPFGIPTIYPQIPDIPPYHNNGIWPFVQAYWNWAVSETKSESSLNHGLASIFRPAALFLTNKENMVAESGDFKGTQINSDRQLWSVAGNLAMVYRIFLGMDFTVDGLKFSPTIPKAYEGRKELRGFNYRNAVLDITVEGYGDEIASMKVNGVEVVDYKIPVDITGQVEVEIKMNNNFTNKQEGNQVRNAFSPTTPDVRLDNHTLKWELTHPDDTYEIFRNGEFVEKTKLNEYSLNGKLPGLYQVRALNHDKHYSFLSEPLPYYSDRDQKIYELEDKVDSKSTISISDYSGTGAVLTNLDQNTSISFPVSIDEPGTFLVQLRYSNGNGPWNTDNNCGIRTFTVNEQNVGTFVFPQRGTGEWSNWGYSNQIEIELDKGDHSFQIEYLPHNRNMDGQINEAMIDYMSLTRILKY